MRTTLVALGLWAIGQTVSLAGIAVVGGLDRSHTVKPGESFEGIILVRNTGTEPVEVRVHQTDYQFFADGRNLYERPGNQPRSNADWISVRPSRFTIAPNEIVSVSYKGVVPKQENLSGTYWSMVMVEPESTAPVQQVGLGLQTKIRFGVQLVTEVGETARAAIKVLDKKLITGDGKRKLQLDLENSGQRLLVPAVWVELFNKQGQSVGKFEAGRSRIFPACSVRYNIDLSDVPAGHYSALVIVDNGDEHVMGAQYELEIQP